MIFDCQKVKNLNLPLGQYAIFGSGPMAARDLRANRDIDIIVTEDLFEKLRADNCWNYQKIKQGSRIVESLNRDNIEIFKSWVIEDWDIKKLIKQCDLIDGLPFVRLADVLKWKKSHARPKDLQDVVLIENYLKNNLDY